MGWAAHLNPPVGRLALLAGNRWVCFLRAPPLEFTAGYRHGQEDLGSRNPDHIYSYGSKETKRYPAPAVSQKKWSFQIRGPVWKDSSMHPATHPLSRRANCIVPPGRRE